MPTRYGSDISLIGKIVPFEQTNDPSLDLLYGLAFAHAAAKRLESLGYSLTLGASPIVLPTIERAYREAIHVRKDISDPWLSIDRISKFGRVLW